MTTDLTDGKRILKNLSASIHGIHQRGNLFFSAVLTAMLILVMCMLTACGTESTLSYPGFAAEELKCNKAAVSQLGEKLWEEMKLSEAAELSGEPVSLNKCICDYTLPSREDKNYPNSDIIIFAEKKFGGYVAFYIDLNNGEPVLEYIDTDAAYHEAETYTDNDGYIRLKNIYEGYSPNLKNEVLSYLLDVWLLPDFESPSGLSSENVADYISLNLLKKVDYYSSGEFVYIDTEKFLPLISEYLPGASFDTSEVDNSLLDDLGMVIAIHRGEKQSVITSINMELGQDTLCCYVTTGVGEGDGMRVALKKTEYGYALVMKQQLTGRISIPSSITEPAAEGYAEAVIQDYSELLNCYSDIRFDDPAELSSEELFELAAITAEFLDDFDVNYKTGKYRGKNINNYALTGRTYTLEQIEDVMKKYLGGTYGFSPEDISCYNKDTESFDYDPPRKKYRTKSCVTYPYFETTFNGRMETYATYEKIGAYNAISTAVYYEYGCRYDENDELVWTVNYIGKDNRYWAKRNNTEQTGQTWDISANLVYGDSSSAQEENPKRKYAEDLLTTYLLLLSGYSDMTFDSPETLTSEELFEFAVITASFYSKYGPNADMSIFDLESAVYPRDELESVLNEHLGGCYNFNPEEIECYDKTTDSFSYETGTFPYARSRVGYYFPDEESGEVVMYTSQVNEKEESVEGTELDYLFTYGYDDSGSFTWQLKQIAACITLPVSDDESDSGTIEVFMDGSAYAEDFSEYNPVVETGCGELIDTLYSYILKAYYCPGMELVYRDEKVTSETLDDYTKQMTVYDVFGTDGLEERTETKKFSYGELTFVYKIYPKALFEERLKKIYGSDATIKHGPFYPSNGAFCEYVEDGEYYRCNEANTVPKNYRYNFTDFVKAVESGDFIYIYDRYYYSDILFSGIYSDTIRYYACSEGKCLFAEYLKRNNAYRRVDTETGEVVLSSNIIAVKPLYQHTFKKASDGSYYWVSTEPATDIDKIVLPSEPSEKSEDELLAEKLYGYIEKNNYYGKELLYRRGKTELSDLDDYTKQMAVFVAYGMDGLKYVMSGYFSECMDSAKLRYIYPVSLFEERLKTIFGSDAEVRHSAFAPRDGFYCIYSEKDKCYYCGADTGGGDSGNNNLAIFLSYKKSGDEFIIYDKYGYITNQWGELGEEYTVSIYYCSEGENLMTELNWADVSESGQMTVNGQTIYKKFYDNMTVYKHTLKKAADGSYYWVSTEMADGENGIAEEAGEIRAVPDSERADLTGRKLWETFGLAEKAKASSKSDYEYSVGIEFTYIDAMGVTELKDAKFVVFGKSKASQDKAAAFYFSENDGVYSLVYTDMSASYHVPENMYSYELFEKFINGDESVYPQIEAVSLDTVSYYDMIPQYNFYNASEKALCDYGTLNALERCGYYLSEGLKYVNAIDFRVSWAHAASVSFPIYSDAAGGIYYSSGYMVFPPVKSFNSVLRDSIVSVKAYGGDNIYALFHTGSEDEPENGGTLINMYCYEKCLGLSGTTYYVNKLDSEPSEYGDMDKNRAFAEELIGDFGIEEQLRAMFGGDYRLYDFERKTRSQNSGNDYFIFYYETVNPVDGAAQYAICQISIHDFGYTSPYLSEISYYGRESQ